MRRLLGRSKGPFCAIFLPKAKAMSNQATDTELMLRYQKGEVRAFEYLLDRYQGPIFNFILRSVRSRALAEELTQETFVRVIKNAQKYKKKAKFTTWLYTIARNICIDQSRRAKHRKTESLDKKLGQGESSQTLLDRMSDNQPSPAHASSNKELQSSLLAALDTLGDEQREVFVLRQIQQLSFKEIAEVVGVSENTIKSRMRYALEKLRLELAELAPTTT